MFTGLIEEVGVVRALEVNKTAGSGSAVLTIGCEIVTDDAAIGDSIAVNGVCLTVTELLPDGGFACDMMGETLARTSLGDIEEGSSVNLERAMVAGDRLGGHMVQGHVDGVSEILDITEFPEWTTVTYTLPAELVPYVVEKGSITIDGTSLTVTAADEATFSVGLIPHTMAVTTHGARRVGDRVNLEVDIIAKYVERQLATRGLTEEKAIA
ncbi:riboflavin synthase [Euzebya tangerina]|uniref:riboflavin synthase n=1 Tax=Euzebya tangerina TaxID=591198 RepID=UPI000E312143|nr:riboflavin synthase [Euzebya tangerina]